LYEDEAAILTRLGAVQKRMAELADLDPRFRNVAEQVTAARLSIEDCAYFLRDYIDGIDVSPEQIHSVEDRLARSLTV
jgi:DNA repair protein RecN (Recombination protein N)